ncbi:MAG: hypothetical protein HKN24_04220 [Acidimicrobiales bacterium]|nr:hypothetical protein [Acidimicrobiales bacterium]
MAHGPLGSVLVWTSVHPGRGHAEQACVVWAPDAPPVAMIEADIPIPGSRWEFRTHGLWVEQVCETPHQHWSFGLEAFALQLDDPTELVRTGYGTRVPMGWELDFYSSAPSRWLLTSADPVGRSGAYTQAGNLSGLLLDADGEHPFEAAAQRWHWWGTTPLTSAGVRTAPVSTGDSIAELHLPLTQGPVVVERGPSHLLIRTVDTVGRATEPSGRH